MIDVVEAVHRRPARRARVGRDHERRARPRLPRAHRGLRPQRHPPQRARRAQSRRARRGRGLRRAGAPRARPLGPLDGIPYTAKDSYMVRGLTVAVGLARLRRSRRPRDAFTIERLRDAGCVFIGLTNMPPMANGGMQRGLYGRAESPYNADYLTSAFGSGSSNGSGTATAARFAAFGLGEETWSSGRAPASNNALCAYTPSRGVISVRGNWPLVPTMDVVVPHTRTMADLLEVLDVIVADDPDTRGDFWRTQPWVPIPRSSDVRPASYPALAADAASALAGKRFGIPRDVPRRRSGCRHRAPGIGGLDRSAHRDPPVGARPVGAGEGRPRGRRRRGRGRRLPGRQQLRGRPRRGAVDLRPRHRAAPTSSTPRSGTCRCGRGTTSSPRTASRGSRRSPTSTARRSSRIPRARSPTATARFDLDISEYVTRARANGMTDPLGGLLAELDPRRARGSRADAPHRPRGVDGRARPRRGRLPRGRRRRPRRRRRERGVRGRRRGATACGSPTATSRSAISASRP